MNENQAAKKAFKKWIDMVIDRYDTVTPVEHFYVGFDAGLAAAQERVDELSKRLAECVEAIEKVPEHQFGYVDSVNEPRTWPIRNELIARAQQALGDKK